MAQAPEGWHTVTPRIFADDVTGLIEFMGRVFGATWEGRGDAPTEVWIGDSVVMVSGTQVRAAMPACLYVYVEDVDAVFGRATAEAVEVVEEPRDLPYGDRRVTFGDRWGNLWQVATRS